MTEPSSQQHPASGTGGAAESEKISALQVYLTPAWQHFLGAVLAGVFLAALILGKTYGYTAAIIAGVATVAVPNLIRVATQRRLSMPHGSATSKAQLVSAVVLLGVWYAFVWLDPPTDLLPWIAAAAGLCYTGVVYWYYRRAQR